MMRSERQEFAGLLRERVRIERPVGQRDNIGSAVPGQMLIGHFAAMATPRPPGPEAAAASRASLARWRFVMRPGPPILPGDWLFWGPRQLLIRTVTAEHRMIPKIILDTEEIR